MSSAIQRELIRSQSASPFARAAKKITAFSGTTFSFCAALILVLVWAGSGLLVHYSETWQLVINIGTTIITFLMVFLIQRAQKKQGFAGATPQA